MTRAAFVLVYGVGVAFCFGVIYGDNAHSWTNYLAALLWPVAIPLVWLADLWGRRQTRRWNALTMDQRRWLNEHGMGSESNRWPYRYTPHVPFRYGR